MFTATVKNNRLFAALCLALALVTLALYLAHDPERVRQF